MYISCIMSFTHPNNGSRYFSLSFQVRNSILGSLGIRHLVKLKEVLQKVPQQRKDSKGKTTELEANGLNLSLTWLLDRPTTYSFPGCALCNSRRCHALRAQCECCPRLCNVVALVSLLHDHLTSSCSFIRV